VGALQAEKVLTLVQKPTSFNSSYLEHLLDATDELLEALSDAGPAATAT
jgi:hypothetical protein